MLKLKRIVCLLSFTLILEAYNMSTITPFNNLATGVVEDKEIENENNIEHQNLINETKSEKLVQRDLIEEKKEKDKNDQPEWKDFILTFYTSLESENSSSGPVTCENKLLSPGGVANNIIPLHTKIYLEGYGQVTVNDRGSDKYFGVDNRLDVFIEREPGESDKHYFKRVNDYGIQTVHGYIVK